MSKRHSMENLELVKLTPDKVNVRTAPLYCSAHTSSTRRASCYITLCYWTCDDCDPFLCWRVKSGTATSWPNSPNPRWLRAPPSSSLLVVCEGRSTSLVAPVRSSRTPAIPWIPVSHLHRDHKKYADLGHSFEDHSESTHVFKIKQLLLFYFYLFFSSCLFLFSSDSAPTCSETTVSLTCWADSRATAWMTSDVRYRTEAAGYR